MPGASLVGIGLVVGLAALMAFGAWWTDRKVPDFHQRQRDIVNVRNKAFYGAIGEKWYPHRNADGTTSHFPT
jgi:hypothetical protein